MQNYNNILDLASQCADMDDESIGLLLQGLKEEASVYRAVIGAVSYEIHKRLLANKGTELPHSTLTIKRVGKVEYDVGKMTALRELLSPDDAEELVTEKHTPAKTQTVVDGRKARSLLIKYGAESEVGKAIVAARLAESTSFSVKEKK